MQPSDTDGSGRGGWGGWGGSSGGRAGAEATSAKEADCELQPVEGGAAALSCDKAGETGVPSWAAHTGAGGLTRRPPK